MNTGEFFRLDPNDELAKRIAYLINGYNLKKLTTSEHRELDEWVTASMQNQKLFEEFTDPANLKKWLRVMESLNKEEALKRIRLKAGLEPASFNTERRRNGYWMVAAALVGLIVSGVYIILTPKVRPRDSAHIKQDLQPGSKHALLIIGDQAGILLDTLPQGVLTRSEGHISKDSDGLIYVNKKNEHPVALMNELITPPGGEYQVKLSDGTRVWLNAASSLKYPERFTDSVRKVVLTGEAYFEVSKDAVHPFIVETANSDIRVLGTHFDVNAYPADNITTVTLAEGSVKLNGAVILKPQERGLIGAPGEIKVEAADLQAALAWKEGRFFFRMTSMEEVMRQVSHWYNARIVYKDNVTEHFNASIPRDVPASRLLHLLESTGRVHFNIQDNTITVLR